MKVCSIILFFWISFTAQGADKALAKYEIDLFLALSSCLKHVPNSDINNPEHQISKELSLTTSVIENIATKLGSNTQEQLEYRELFKVAHKHCSKEINKLEIHYKSMANKQINRDK